MDWQIVLEDTSSITKDISLIKILLKIVYINTTILKKNELNIILDEKSFEVFLI
jgi:hypothetical protein